MSKVLIATAVAALLIESAYGATPVASYDFNDFAQMADWTVVDNHDGTLTEIGPEETWKAAGGVDGSGHVRLVHEGTFPNTQFTLDAHTFDRDSAHISFSVASNDPAFVAFYFGPTGEMPGDPSEGPFFFNANEVWFAGNEASLGGKDWQENNPVFHLSNMDPFGAPDWPGAVFNDIEVTIIDGFVDVMVNGEVLVTGADWNAVLQPTGNIFHVENYQVSFVAFDNYSQGPATTPDFNGDYTGDGNVDAADYVLWRRDPASFGGDPDGYDAWRANFGAMAGSGAATVPEPTAGTLVTILVAVYAIRRRATGTKGSFVANTTSSARNG